MDLNNPPPSGGPASDPMSEDILSAMSSLQTDNRDDLLEQMKRLIGDYSLTDATAKFYLEMNGWNVAAAVGSYFDLEASPAARAHPPAMTFVKDVTIGEGEAIPPDTPFIKTWTVQNTGADRWPEGCALRFTQGHQLSAEEGVAVNPLLPWQRADISVPMRSPREPGIYESKWRMSSGGNFFGDTIWVIITVSAAGTMGLTQQMSSFSALGAEQQQQARVEQQINPFAVPSSPARQQAVVTDPPRVIMPSTLHIQPPPNPEDDDMSMN